MIVGALIIAAGGRVRKDTVKARQKSNLIILSRIGRESFGAWFPWLAYGGGSHIYR